MIMERAGRQLVKERLRLSEMRKQELEAERKWIEIGLERRIGAQRFEDWSRIVKAKGETVFLKVRAAQQKKMSRWLEKRVDCKVEAKETMRSKWVVNLSDHELSRVEWSVLEKGLNFSPSPKTIPSLDIIAAMELTIGGMKDTVKAELTRAKIGGIIRRAERPSPNVSKEERVAVKDLLSNDGIVIAPADKGNATVVLNKSDYEAKARSVIEKKPFEKVKRNPKRKVEEGINKIAWNLFQNRRIKRPFYDFLRSSASPLPRFYGRVKLHKVDHPVRPVISAVGTATYNASKFLAEIISPLVGHAGYTVRNSKEFVANVAGMEIAPEEIMISFDVEALYTSLPIDRVLKHTQRRLEEDRTLSERTDLTVQEILSLLKFCLQSTYFTFREEFYHLTDGVAMGSPISSVVANLFMEVFESEAIEKAERRDIAPRLWDRYVDDVFAIIERRKVGSFLQHLNEQDPNIRFTTEEEQEGKLPFLDVLVTRHDGELRTGVYRKKTHTDRVLSFHSHHPMSAKRSVVGSLFARIDTHFDKNDNVGREEERQHLVTALQQNDYPRKFIEDTLSRINRKKERENETEERKNEPRSVVVLPYVDGVSQQIAKVLQQVDIRTAMKAQSWQWRLCRGIKDAIPQEDRKSVVYEVSCKDCMDQYVGETIRSMAVRIKEHARHTRDSRIDLSAVAEHAAVNGHEIDWATAKVIDSAKTTQARKVKEALHIARKAPKMNKDQGMILSASWHGAIGTLNRMVS